MLQFAIELVHDLPVLLPDQRTGDSVLLDNYIWCSSCWCSYSSAVLLASSALSEK